MALNITFTGEIFDSSLSPIDCNYQVHYVRQGIWSPIAPSEFGQYNFNAGTSTHLSQEGELKVNDVVIVTFFLTPDRNNAESQPFAAIAFVHDGSTSTYIQNVQLLQMTLPDCNWELTNSTINTPIVATSNTVLSNEYFFDTIKHYQKKSIYSVVIFPTLDFTSVEYDFGSGFSTTDTFVYTSIGDYIVFYRATSNAGVIECNKYLRIKFNPPIPDILFSPTSAIVGSEINVIANINDIDGTITNIDHSLNGTLIESNTIVDYQYSFVVESLGINESCQTITWFDGYESKVLNHCEQLSTENQSPSIRLEYTKEDNVIDLISNAVDPEGALAFVRYNIYVCKDTIFESNTTCTNWVLLDSRDVSELDTQLTFYNSGTFKVTAQAFDDGGLFSAIDEVIFDIECQGSGGGYFDWSKTTTQLKFQVKEETVKFNSKEEQRIKFKLSQENIKFKIDVTNIKFKVKEETITFKGIQCQV